MTSSMWDDQAVLVGVCEELNAIGIKTFIPDSYFPCAVVSGSHILCVYDLKAVFKHHFAGPTIFDINLSDANSIELLIRAIELSLSRR